MIITKEKIKHLSALLNQHNISDDTRKDLIFQFSEGRTESRKELKLTEAIALISFLSSGSAKFDPRDKMRKKILSMFHEMGYKKEGELDLEHVKTTIEKYGYLHKPLNDYQKNELPKLISQITKMRDTYLKKVAS
jgi:hypothetical protein